MSAMEWQPIETVPKDGSQVLLYRPLAQNSGDPVVTICRTVEFNQFCWKSTIPDGCEPINFTEGSCYPTHWMPLPEPPK